MSGVIGELKRLEAEATKGPWSTSGAGDAGEITVRGGEYEDMVAQCYTVDGHLDAALIAATRNALPKLVAIAEAARAYEEAVAVYEDAVAVYEDACARFGRWPTGPTAQETVMRTTRAALFATLTALDAGEGEGR